MFTLGIFSRFEGRLGMLKSLRLLIKGGSRAYVKGFTTFTVSSDFRGFLVSLHPFAYEYLFWNLVFGDPFRFSHPPTLAPTVVPAEK
jgi:hypothetical protein